MSKLQTPPVVLEMKAEKVRQGLTDADLAGLTGMTIDKVRRLLNGHTRMSLTDSLRFAEALGTPLSKLQDRAEQNAQRAA